MHPRRHQYFPCLQVRLTLHQQRGGLRSSRLGVTSAIKIGIRRLRIQEDSKLIIKQVNVNFALKEVDFVPYRTTIQKLVKAFDNVQFQHMLRAHNQHVDALSTLTSKIDIPNNDIGVSIIRSTLRATAAELTATDIPDEQDWSIPIMKELA